MRFDKVDRTIRSYRYNGVSAARARAKPRLLARRRPTTTAARGRRSRERRRGPERQHRAVAGGERRRGRSQACAVEQVDDADRARSWSMPICRASAPAYSMTYTIHGTGDVDRRDDYKPGAEKLPMMPRFGTELVVAPGSREHRLVRPRPARDLRSTGSSSASACTRSTVDDEWVEYMRPQENGNKTDVRWVALTNAQGRTARRRRAALSVSGTPLHQGRYGARRATPSRCSATREVFLNLDWKQMGVGGIDSWSPNAWPIKAYRIDPTQPLDLQVPALARERRLHGAHARSVLSGSGDPCSTPLASVPRAIHAASAASTPNPPS